MKRSASASLSLAVAVAIAGCVVKGSNCGLAFTEPFIEKSFSKTPSGRGAGPYVWTVSPKAKAAVFGNARSGVLFVETGDPGNKSGVAFYLIIKK